MSSSNSGRRPKKPTGNRSRPAAPRPTRSVGGVGQDGPEFSGLLGWLIRNRRLLSWLELIVAILLIALALNGFLGGAVWLPFAFGLLGLRFFYAYVQHNLGINFGRTGTVLNLVLLLGALVCAVIGIAGNEYK